MTTQAKPITAFIVINKDDVIDSIVTDNYTLLDLPGDWKLGALRKEVFEKVAPEMVEFEVLYLKAAKEAFGYVDHEFEVISRDKVERFYKLPTTAHFLGLMLGWSLVGSDYQTMSQMTDNADCLDWVKIDEDCWYGDIDSVILNLVMPKNGGGACGCGDNESAVNALGKFLNTQRNHPIVITDEERDVHRKEGIYDQGLLGSSQLFIAYIVDAAGFSEHGGSVFHGWLQTNGVYLAFLIAESAAASARINAE